MGHKSRRDFESDPSESDSDVSKRSGSGSASRSSRSPSGSRSGSAASKRSSRHSGGSRSGSASGSARSGSAASRRSRSGSASASNRSRSRSKTGSPRSRSGSGSRSAAGSDAGNRSERSRSRSGSGSRSRSGTPQKRSGSDSGSDVVVRQKKKRQREDTDDDAEKPEVADIFGEDLGDISDDDDNDDNEKENEPEREIRRMGDIDDDEDGPAEPPPQVPETRIDVEVPRIQTDLGDDLHFVKLPNFLSVETRPYDPETYEDEVDEDEVIDEEGRARLKLKVENTIRWRTVYDNETGDPIKQSNARVVRWSDGSLSLHLGSEIFDVHKQTLLTGDHNHLFIRQGTGLQGQAVFRTKLSFRPHSTDSFTHRKMTLSLAGRSQKANKVRVLPTVGLDPEKNRNEMMKKEEEKLRAFMRRDNKQRRIRDRVKGMNAAYLEDDEDGISLNAIKQNAKSRPSASNIYSSDTDDSDIDGIRRRKASDKAKKIQDSDEEEEDYFDKKEREVSKQTSDSKASGNSASDSDKKSDKSGSASDSDS